MNRCALLGLLAIAAYALIPENPAWPQDAQTFGPDLIARVRQAAGNPAQFPTAINYAKFAESHRPMSDIIEGGGPQRYVSARTAFQLVYRTDTVMIDAGMDQTVHKFFGFGREEPYWPERNAAIQRALKEASQILLTHEHGDHAAGVIRSDARAQLAGKTMMTVEQMQTLMTDPQLPEIRLTPEIAASYTQLRYRDILGKLPGVVLIKAPGHTPGHQMIYVRLDSGREFLLIGDVGWTLDNVTQLKLRPAATMRRINEDGAALMQQLRWIKGMMEQEKLIVIPSHDDRLLQDLAARSLIGDGLLLR